MKAIIVYHCEVCKEERSGCFDFGSNQMDIKDCVTCEYYLTNTVCPHEGKELDVPNGLCPECSGKINSEVGIETPDNPKVLVLVKKEKKREPEEIGVDEAGETRGRPLREKSRLSCCAQAEQLSTMQNV